MLAAPSDGNHCYAVTVAGVKINGAVQTPYEGPELDVSSTFSGVAFVGGVLQLQ